MNLLLFIFTICTQFAEHMTPGFEEFLNIFSDKIDLKDFKGYRGGLDCKS